MSVGSDILPWLGNNPRSVRRLIIIFTVLLAGFGGCVFLAGSVLLAPARASISEASLPLPHEKVEFRGASGNVLHGWYVPASNALGTIVLMHGVRANRLSMVGRAEMLHRAGYSVLLFDFQAHGESPGSHITMGYLESADARAAVAYARSRAAGQFIGAIGVSLGGVQGLVQHRAGDRAVQTLLNARVEYSFTPNPFIGVVAAIAIVAFVAAAVPAVRAARTNVIEAIGYE